MALLIGYGAGAINPYLAFETLDDMIREGELRRPRPQDGDQELHQGAEQGHPQGHVQDGHLHRPALHRRPDLRGHRAEEGVRRQILHVDGVAHRGHRRRGDGRRGAGAAPTGLPGPPAGRARPGGRRSSTSGGATASITSSTRRRSSSCSTRRAPSASRSSRSTPPWSTTRTSSCATLRGLFRFKPLPSPSRSRKSSRSRRSSSGSAPGRCPTARSATRRTRRWPSP